MGRGSKDEGNSPVALKECRFSVSKLETQQAWLSIMGCKYRAIQLAYHEPRFFYKILYVFNLCSVLFPKLILLIRFVGYKIASYLSGFFHS